jgi:hypothetical protein
MCKEMPVIPVNKVVDPRRIIGKNEGPRRRKGTRGCLPPPPKKKNITSKLSPPGRCYFSVVIIT